MSTTRRPQVRWLAAVALALALFPSSCGRETPAPGSPAWTSPSPSTAGAATIPAPSSRTIPASTTTSLPTKPAPATSTAKPRPSTSTPRPSACSVPSRLLGRDLTKVPTDRKVVALTFDAGAGDDGVASILATLADKGVPATFFVTGDFVDDFPTSARAMAKYPIGNHTYNHPDLTTLSDSRIRTEIDTAESRIKAVTGQDPRPYFRFPFGAVNAHTTALVNAECYVPFRWTVDTLGWKGTSEGQSVSSVVNRVLDTATPGQIVLMHLGAHPKDRSTLDADALPRVIDGLRQRGCGFVTLQSVLGPAP